MGLAFLAGNPALPLDEPSAPPPAGLELSHTYAWQRPANQPVASDQVAPELGSVLLGRSFSTPSGPPPLANPRALLRREHGLFCVDGPIAEGFRAWHKKELEELAQIMGSLPATRDEDEGIASVCLVRATPSIHPIHVASDGDPGRRIYVFAADAFQGQSRGATQGESVRSGTLERAVLSAFFADAAKLGEILRLNSGYETGVPAGGLHRPLNETELLLILGILVDLPAEFRFAPGLESFVRRRDGSRNPDLPNAPALSYVEEGYIEFTDLAFAGKANGTERILVHEIAHFVYANRLSEGDRQDWRDLSAWHQDPVEGWWHHEQSTSFVTPYAASLSPAEDFAETLAAYVTNPERARSLTPDKYRFGWRFMGGYEYLTQTRDRYTFRVYSTYHDASAPAYVESLMLRCWKIHSEDPQAPSNNLVQVEMRLAGGARVGDQCYLRMFSPSALQYVDLHLKNEEGVLRGEVEIDAYAESGAWAPRMLRIEDAFGNARYQDAATIGWRLWIDNPEDDLDAPRPLWSAGHARRSTRGEDTELRVHLPIAEAHPEGARAQLSLASPSGQVVSAWGQFDADLDGIQVQLTWRDYHDSGSWRFRGVRLFDRAGNGRYYEAPDWLPAVEILTKRPDRRGPELDAEGVRIVSARGAEPGETEVSITYGVRDDISGFVMAYVVIESPSGRRVGEWQYEADRSHAYPQGDVQSWQERESRFMLPDGSEPGFWTLREIVLYDRAGNHSEQTFVTRGILIAD